ncbi:solanesyl diphosphate synthase, partial [Candidatus Gastranaerophilus sp. (ex Termes propinquus)]
RRNKECWHTKYDPKLAIVAGDYLLALSLKIVAQLNSPLVLEIFTENMLKVCNGEIAQYFKRYEVPSVEEYIKKSELKTGLLFFCIVKSALVLSDVQNTQAEEFARKFGIAFQLKNDLKDAQEDIENGVYTLCSIYFKQENPKCDKINSNEKAKMKAAEFLNKFIDDMVQGFDFAQNEGLRDCCEFLRRA